MHRHAAWVQLWPFLACVASCQVSGSVPVGQRDVAEQVVLSHEWIEIEPTPPLRVNGRWPELVVHHSPDLTLTRAAIEHAVYSPKLDELIRLDVELIDADGEVHEFGSGGLSPGRLALRALDPAPPGDLSVTLLRLRANLPFAVSKLEWCGPATSE